VLQKCGLTSNSRHTQFALFLGRFHIEPYARIRFGINLAQGKKHQDIQFILRVRHRYGK
jgi:hypothetical protein